MVLAGTRILIVIATLVLTISPFSKCHSQSGAQSLSIKISHTAIFTEKSGWSKVYSFKPISINYQPAQKLIIISRLKVPDSLHITDITRKELAALPQKFGNFKLVGEFEDYNLPPDFLSLFYIDPKTHDVLEVGRRLKDAKGNKMYWRAVLYMQDSINYMKNSKLFLELKKQ